MRKIKDSIYRTHLQALKIKGIKISVIARKIDVTQQHLSAYALGVRNLSEATEAKLAELLLKEY